MCHERRAPPLAPRASLPAPVRPALPDPAIARAQLHAPSRHPDATATERHFALEALRVPVSLEVAEVCCAGVERVIGGRETGEADLTNATDVLW